MREWSGTRVYNIQIPPKNNWNVIYYRSFDHFPATVWLEPADKCSLLAAPTRGHFTTLFPHCTPLYFVYHMKWLYLTSYIAMKYNISNIFWSCFSRQRKCKDSKIQRSILWESKWEQVPIQFSFSLFSFASPSYILSFQINIIHNRFSCSVH